MVRILTVEDDAAIRRGIVDALSFAGYDVIEAANGTDGCAAAVARAYDLLLLDMVLPGIDGEHLARLLRADLGCRDVALVGLSASDEPDVRERALDAGCDEFLAKPVSPSNLVAAVERYTKHHVGL